MKLPELAKISLVLKNGEELTILNPKLKSRKGHIILDGILDQHQFTDFKDIEEKLEMQSGTTTKKVSELFVMRGINSFGSQVEIFPVDVNSIQYPSLNVSFLCYGYIDEIIPARQLPEVPQPNVVYSLCFEGLKMNYTNLTTIKRERDILNEFESDKISFKKDFIESHLNFYFKEQLYELDVALINIPDEKFVVLRFANKNRLPLKVYEKIKFSLTTFLSFATGNNLIIRSEHFTKDSDIFTRTFSGLESKQRSYSDFIPLNEINFLHKRILPDYFECFNTYLFLDEFLALSELILLFNNAKKSPVDSSIFLMLVALEKLGDKFIKSRFHVIKEGYIIDDTRFKLLIKKTIQQFEADFSTLKNEDLKDAFSDLKSKICGINKKGKTDNKIDQLLEFVEIPKSSEINRLFPILRNKAIHQGEIHLPEANAYKNKVALELLLNRIIANLIQYKGIRFIRRETNKNIGEQKKRYKTDYTQLGMKRAGPEIIYPNE
jgi:hypothetical protein